MPAKGLPAKPSASASTPGGLPTEVPGSGSASDGGYATAMEVPPAKAGSRTNETGPSVRICERRRRLLFARASALRLCRCSDISWELSHPTRRTGCHCIRR
jgi:hypothetical protein